MNLLTILKELVPEQLSNGQIRSKCPFRDKHEDGSGQQSMFWSPDRNTYHCFSCKSSGQMVRLLTTRFEVPYFEAKELVSFTLYTKEKKSEVTDDYGWKLTPPKKYLERGYTEEILRKYKVGIAGKGMIVVPMFDGHILKGMQYQIGSGDDRKMWSSEGFDREHFLYNGFNKYTDEVTIVEGPSDVWRLDMFGEQVWGNLGTEMSEWQAEQLCKVKKVHIASDTDGPGVFAADKWYKKIHKHTDVDFINYPAKDPGAILSRRVWLKCKREAFNYAEFKYLTGLD